MAEEEDCKKGQNLEMIVSKLAKEKPANGLGNLILISGVNVQNISFPSDNGDSEEEHEPDLHQCGKCKQMFVNLEKYLRHRTGKLCRKKTVDVQDNSDDASSPRQMQEVVQMEATTPNLQDCENDQQELANRRKHERKGVARKRTNAQPERTGLEVANISHARMLPIDRLQEIIHPAYSTSAPFVNIEGFRRNYVVDSGVPNNNDLYALMELTKNSGIKEVENEPAQHHETLNGDINPTFPRPSLSPSTHLRVSTPLMVHKHLPTIVSTSPILHQYPGVESADSSSKGVKRRYKCDKCDREFNQRANLRRHQLVHSGEKPFECVQCQRRFQQQGDLKRHMLRHTENPWYHCQLCAKKFMRVDRWKLHMKAHEENGEVVGEMPMMQQETNGTLEDAEEGKGKVLGSHHICSKCNQTFMEPDELLVHTCADGNISVMTVAMDTRGKEETENSAANAMAEGLGGNVAADADHSRTYSSSRAASKGKLTNPHKCPLCNAYYKNVDSLKTHILKHSGEKKYKCDQCPKAFFTSSNLKIHKRIHSGDKPLKCKICFKAFSDPSNFNKHKKSHSKGVKNERGPGRKGKNARAPAVRDETLEGISEGPGETIEGSLLMKRETMEFTSRPQEFVQSQYEALLPALGESSGQEGNVGELKEGLEAEQQNNENSEFVVPFIESPSF